MIESQVVLDLLFGEFPPLESCEFTCGFRSWEANNQEKSQQLSQSVCVTIGTGTKASLIIPISV